MHTAVEAMDSKSKLWLWHARIGHQGFRTLRRLSQQHNLLPEFSNKLFETFKRRDCDKCQEGDIHAQPIHKQANPQYRASRPLGRLHADLMGWFTLTIDGEETRQRFRSLNGYEYVLVITDEFTHTVFVFPLRNKAEASGYIKELILQLQVEITGLTLGEFHADQAGEFINNELIEFFAENGTKFTTSETGVSQHNGVAERMNRTLQSMTRIMMVHAGAPQILWEYAIAWAAHVHNSTLKGKFIGKHHLNYCEDSTTTHIDY